jgi:hypothetical protein
MCEAQETLKRFSPQIPFGVLKLASASTTTCCQFAGSRKGDDITWQTEAASEKTGSTACAASCVRSTGNPQVIQSADFLWSAEACFSFQQPPGINR